MTYFIKRGDCFRLSDEESLDIHKKLPPGNYTIVEDLDTKELYLEKVESFEIKHKVYANTIKNTDRIFTTFTKRPNSTGVLLSGEKGSGKTLLAKSLAMKCFENNIPTILINFAWHGDKFNQLIQDITQPCMILFDEFEKVYKQDQQPAVLTLLDGVYPSKKLFVLTCNDVYRLDTHLKNRPGRIFYLLEFKGLEEHFIKEYCNDTLENKTYLDGICKISKIFSEFNFDMLKAIVEEVNRYNETPEQVLSMLNIKPEFTDQSTFKVELIVDGEKIIGPNLDDRTWYGNPLGAKSISIGVSEGNDYTDYEFTLRDLILIDAPNDKFVFKNQNNQLTLFKERKYSFNPLAF